MHTESQQPTDPGQPLEPRQPIQPNSPHSPGSPLSPDSQQSPGSPLSPDSLRALAAHRAQAAHIARQPTEPRQLTELLEFCCPLLLSRTVLWNFLLACRSRQASIVLEWYFRFEVSLLSFYACERNGPIRVSGGSDIIT